MNGGLVLALDCSTVHLAVALVDETGVVLGSSAPEVGRDHAARLPLEFADLLAHAGRERDDIAQIRVGTGPGSYTGTRVGIAAAKGLARALGVPLAGVSSFVGLAAGVLEAGSTAVVTLDARRGNVYAQVCRHDGPARDDPGRLQQAGRTGAPGRETAFTPARAPNIVTVSAVLKVALAEVATRFPGLPVRPAQVPDAAALAVASQTGAAEAVYL